MSTPKREAQRTAQAGRPSQAAAVDAEVGVLHSSEESPVMGAEQRRDACPGVRGGRGGRLREETSLVDAKSPILAVVVPATGAMELDSESRIREIRPSGLMRGEVATPPRLLYPCSMGAPLLH